LLLLPLPLPLVVMMDSSDVRSCGRGRSCLLASTPLLHGGVTCMEKGLQTSDYSRVGRSSNGSSVEYMLLLLLLLLLLCCSWYDIVGALTPLRT